MNISFEIGRNVSMVVGHCARLLRPPVIPFRTHCGVQFCLCLATHLCDRFHGSRKQVARVSSITLSFCLSVSLSLIFSSVSFLFSFFSYTISFFIISSLSLSLSLVVVSFFPASPSFLPLLVCWILVLGFGLFGVLVVVLANSLGFGAQTLSILWWWLWRAAALRRGGNAGAEGSPAVPGVRDAERENSASRER